MQSIDWVSTDIRYKPNNRGNKIHGSVVYRPDGRYCEGTYQHYTKIETPGFTFYHPIDLNESQFPKNIAKLMYNVSSDQKRCEQQTKIVQHRIYEIYQKESKRNDMLWQLANKFLDNTDINKDLMKLVGQSDIYLFTLRNVLDGFSEVARLKAQYDLVIKKIRSNKNSE